MTADENILLIQKELSADFNIPVTAGKQALLQELAHCINHLIDTNFSRLVHILYRIDISEQALTETLRQQPHQDAGLLIASLIIERQLQKQQMRSQFKRHDNIPDDEKW